MRSFLQLTRAHTAPLEVIPAVIGASLATGSFWHQQTLIWGIFGFLYHLSGYGMNSYTDWKGGYDKDDPHKEHHPLNTGAITPRSAKSIVSILFVITVAYALIAASNIESYAVLFIGAFFGVLYNYYGKVTILKFVFISIAHTTVFAVPYLDSGGSFTDVVFLLGSLYVFLWVVFQISVSGEIKDIDQDEANFLKRLGTEAKRGIMDTSIRSGVYAMNLKMVSYAVLVILLSVVNADLGEYVSVTLIGLIGLFFTAHLIKPGEYNRDGRLTAMALVEMTMVFAFIAASMSIIGQFVAFALVVLSTVWVMVFNYIEWGTLMGPKV